MLAVNGSDRRSRAAVDAAWPVEGPPGSMASERLEEEIGELAAHIHAATCHWLLLIAEFDRREAWKPWGCKSCADWLSLRCALAPGPAREHVRVARRLEQMPLVCAAFASGELSYSKARAITRVVDHADEAELLELARHATAAQLERLVRAYRGVVSTQIEHANRAHGERFLSWSWEDDGSLTVRGRLPAEDGALLVQALEAARDRLRVPAETCGGQDDGEPGAAAAASAAADAGEGAAAAASGSMGDRSVPAETSTGETAQRASATNADAITLMAETLLASGPAQRAAGERYQLVVHVDAGELGGDGSVGRCQLADGAPLPAETARRVACDSSVLAVAMRDGRPLTVGRKTRAVPPALRRALRTRDGGCCFPGCTECRFVDAHHIQHWAHGGETKLSNLLLLCRRHHRLVHEGGFRVEHQHGGRPIFRRPDGRVIQRSPQGQRGDHAEVRRLSRRAGASIGPETCWALSRGERLDVGMAVERLLMTAGLLDPDPVGVPAETPRQRAHPPRRSPDTTTSRPGRSPPARIAREPATRATISEGTTWT